ncbi:MAG TPA: hypothetical protein VHU80_14490 [Polyangiaceae bacterium]|nr:hypothetical protein [Polyangiaceae bacterium]
MAMKPKALDGVTGEDPTTTEMRPVFLENRKKPGCHNGLDRLKAKERRAVAGS